MAGRLLDPYPIPSTPWQSEPVPWPTIAVLVVLGILWSNGVSGGGLTVAVSMMGDRQRWIGLPSSETTTTVVGVRRSLVRWSSIVIHIGSPLTGSAPVVLTRRRSA